MLHYIEAMFFINYGKLNYFFIVFSDLTKLNSINLVKRTGKHKNCFILTCTVLLKSDLSH